MTMLIVLIVLAVLAVLVVLVLVFFLLAMVLGSVRSHSASDHTAYCSKRTATKLMTKESATCRTDQGST